jgi:hypothetical protein
VKRRKKKRIIGKSGSDNNTRLCRSPILISLYATTVIKEFRSRTLHPTNQTVNPKPRFFDFANHEYIQRDIGEYTLGEAMDKYRSDKNQRKHNARPSICSLRERSNEKKKTFCVQRSLAYTTKKRTKKGIRHPSIKNQIRTTISGLICRAFYPRPSRCSRAYTAKTH